MRSILTILSLLLLVPAVILAQGSELVIKDTAGVARSVTQTETASNVEFALTDAAGNPADGVEVVLRDEVTGAELHGVASNGTVVFENVSTGTWVVSSATPGVTFTNITVSAVTFAAGGLTAGGLAILGGGAAVGGTTLAIIDANNNGSSTELSPAS